MDAKLDKFTETVERFLLLSRFILLFSITFPDRNWARYCLIGRREAEEVELPGAKGRFRTDTTDTTPAWIGGVDVKLASLLPIETECLCCTEWDLVLLSMGRLDIYGEEDSTQRDCVTPNYTFPALVNPAIVETLPKINWTKHPRPSESDKQLSVK